MSPSLSPSNDPFVGRQSRIQQLAQLCDEKILVMDGGMGTVIQGFKLAEADYRGERFAQWPQDVKGNNDLLNLTRPDVIEEIHRRYLAAGSDLIETNTFSSTTIAQADYGMQALARELNVQGAVLARKAADALSTPQKPRFVLGAIGPTNRTASISPDVNNPGHRNITFDELRDAYREAAEGLVEGGVDVLLVETIFDTLNAKAALFAIDELFEAQGFALPIIISGTLTDLSGRTLSGQTGEAFWYSVRHARPFAVGLNCALGAEQMRPFVAQIAKVADTRLSVYPNAGLPNELGGYDETPEQFASHIAAWAKDGLVNLVGGCCGTSPNTIAAVAKAVEGITPRKIPSLEPAMRLSGLEPFVLK